MSESPTIVDPLAEVVTMLRPGAPYSKLVSVAGPWSVRNADEGGPFYCAILQGSTRLAVDGHAPVVLEAGDFALVPATQGFVASTLEPPAEGAETPHRWLPGGEMRHGDPDAPADVRMIVGFAEFGAPDAALLVSLLPALLVVRGEPRLTTLVELVREECRARRSARELVLARLLEVLLIEAFRSAAGTTASPGLARGLADERLAIALRLMHADPTRAWTVAELAAEAAMSRSAFFDRFSREVGAAPMAYMLAWRMALAKDLLRRRDLSVAEVAERVGYGSASTFSIAFARHVGQPPARFAKAAYA